MKKIDWLIFTFFLFLTIVFRFSSFFESFIEWDEGLYILVARSFIDGHPPYTAVWDNKPPGIYFLFSLALLLLGNSVFSIRILACITIAITCYFLYRIGKIIVKSGGNSIGLLAGILYLISSLQTDGLGHNTEIFFAPFVTFGFYLLLSGNANPDKFTNQNKSRLFTIGLLFGVGLQIKQVVIFEFIALLLIVGILLYFKSLGAIGHFFKRILTYYILLSIGLLLPFFIILLYYLINGHFDDYVYANFSANLARVSGGWGTLSYFLRVLTEQIFSNSLLWLCLILMPFYLTLFSKKIEFEEKQNLICLLLWFFLAFTSVLLLKGVYNHYYLQLLPSLCIISSYLIIRLVWTVEKLDKNRAFLVLTLILFNSYLTPIYYYINRGTNFIYYRFVKRIDGWGDDYSVIAKYLQKQINKEDYVYVADLPPIIYFLVNARIPTKFAFSYFLHDLNFSKFAGVNPLQELNSIMSKKPIYVIRSSVPPQSGFTINTNNLFYAELDRYLERDYVFEKSIKDVKLYKLKRKITNGF